MKKIIPLFSFVILTTSIFIGCSNSASKNEKESDTNSTEVPQTDSLQLESIEPEEKIFIGLYTRKGDLFGEPCTSNLIVSMKNETIKAVGTDCEDEYSLFNFLSGKKSKNGFDGNFSGIDNCGGDGDENAMCLNSSTFTLKLSPDSSKLVINGNTFVRAEMKINFRLKGKKCLESPDFKAPEVKGVNKSAKSIQLIEIGEMVKQNNQFIIWYRLKVEDKEAWCYDALSL